MKNILLVLGLLTWVLMNGCATPNALQHDSKVAWEDTKQVSGEVWEGTKKVSGEAWEGTKNAVNNAT